MFRMNKNPNRRMTEMQVWCLAKTVFTNTHKMTKDEFYSKGKKTYVFERVVLTDPEHYGVGKYYITGLCSFVHLLKCFDLITEEVYNNVNYKIQVKKDSMKGRKAYIYDLRKEGHAKRVKFIQKQIDKLNAKLTKKEFMALDRIKELSPKFRLNQWDYYKTKVSNQVPTRQSLRCCSLARACNYVCVESRYCPKHGIRCIGSHE